MKNSLEKSVEMFNRNSQQIELLLYSPLKMINFVVKMMKCVVKMMSSVLKMMNCVLAAVSRAKSACVSSIL